jgi:LPS export ABC transporter protein LptC
MIPRSLRTMPTLLLGVGIVLFGCRNDLERVAAVEVPPASPDRVTVGAVYDMVDDGRVRNRLTAGRISEWSGEKRRYELEQGVRVEFLGPDGTPTSTLTAQRGEVLPLEKRMEVNGDVVFVNAKGERLETEQLTWHQDSARVRTDRPVRVVRAHDVLHGEGLDAAEDFSRYVIRRTTGVFHLDARDTL